MTSITMLRVRLFLLEHRLTLLGGMFLALAVTLIVLSTDVRIPLLGQVTAQPACSDTLDNDGDGDTDYPADLGCLTAIETNEWQNAECFDGLTNPLDNDEDGAANSADFSCIILFNGERRPQAFCGDRKDNDGDGLTDYPADSGCASRQDHSEN